MYRNKDKLAHRRASLFCFIIKRYKRRERPRKEQGFSFIKLISLFFCCYGVRRSPLHMEIPKIDELLSYHKEGYKRREQREQLRGKRSFFSLNLYPYFFALLYGVRRSSFHMKRGSMSLHIEERSSSILL